jgi:hypothetical protein
MGFDISGIDPSSSASVVLVIGFGITTFISGYLYQSVSTVSLMSEGYSCSSTYVPFSKHKFCTQSPSYCRGLESSTLLVL